MRELVLGKNHDQVLIGDPAEESKLALKTNDVIDKLFSPVSLENFLTSMAFSYQLIFQNTLSWILGDRNYIPLKARRYIKLGYVISNIASKPVQILEISRNLTVKLCFTVRAGTKKLEFIIITP